MSYAALVSIVVLEAMILRAALSELLRLGAIVDAAHIEPRAVTRLPRRHSIPEFSGRLVDSNSPFCSRHLRGKRAALLFLADSAIDALGFDELESLIYGIRHSGHENLCIVCTAKHEQCRRFNAQYVSPRYGDAVKVVVDESGEIAAIFSADAGVPSAIVIDAEGGIIKTGALALTEF